MPLSIPGLSAAQVQALINAAGKEDVANKATDLTSPDDTKYPSTQAVSTAISAAAPRVLGDSATDKSTTNTDGTEDVISPNALNFDLGNLLTADNQKFVLSEDISAAASGTAARRIKKYFQINSTENLIWDSGALTLSLGGTFHICTTIYRVDANTARVIVVVTTTSASTVPYVMITDILDADWTTGCLIKTKAIASGVGAASGDITFKAGTLTFVPTAAP